QGYVAGHHRRPPRFSRHDQECRSRHQLARFSGRSLCLCRLRLLVNLLQPQPLWARTGTSRSVGTKTLTPKTAETTMTVTVESQTAAEETVIEMKGVNKWYGDFHVLKNIDLSVTEGERI